MVKTGLSPSVTAQGRKLGGRSAVRFVSAGGDVWYSRTLRAYPKEHASSFTSRSGYVAVGDDAREAERFETAKVLIDGVWVPLAEQNLDSTYDHGLEAPMPDDRAE